MSTFVAVAGDRKVAVAEFGDPKGKPVIYLHGAGTSYLEADLLRAEAAENKVRLIAIDRPGSGESDADPKGSILDHARDIVAVADDLGLPTFAIGGTSGGSMYAAAVATLHPDRVTHFFGIVPVLPLRNPTAKPAMPKQLKTLSRFARTLPKLMAAMLGKQFKKIADPAAVAASLGESKQPDAKYMTPTVLQGFSAAARRGQLQGSLWAIRDFALLGSDWGFDPFANTVPATIVTGREDPLNEAGQLYAKWLGGELVTLAGGHLSPLTEHGAKAVVAAMRAAAPASSHPRRVRKS